MTTASDKKYENFSSVTQLEEFLSANNVDIAGWSSLSVPVTTEQLFAELTAKTSALYLQDSSKTVVREQKFMHVLVVAKGNSHVLIHASTQSANEQATSIDYSLITQLNYDQAADPQISTGLKEYFNANFSPDDLKTLRVLKASDEDISEEEHYHGIKDYNIYAYSLIRMQAYLETNEEDPQTSKLKVTEDNCTKEYRWVPKEQVGSFVNKDLAGLQNEIANYDETKEEEKDKEDKEDKDKEEDANSKTQEEGKEEDKNKPELTDIKTKDHEDDISPNRVSDSPTFKGSSSKAKLPNKSSTLPPQGATMNASKNSPVKSKLLQSRIDTDEKLRSSMRSDVTHGSVIYTYKTKFDDIKSSQENLYSSYNLNRNGLKEPRKQWDDYLNHNATEYVTGAVQNSYKYMDLGNKSVIKDKKETYYYDNRGSQCFGRSIDGQKFQEMNFRVPGVTKRRNYHPEVEKDKDLKGKGNLKDYLQANQELDADIKRNQKSKDASGLKTSSRSQVYGQGLTSDTTKVGNVIMSKVNDNYKKIGSIDNISRTIYENSTSAKKKKQREEEREENSSRKNSLSGKKNSSFKNKEDSNSKNQNNSAKKLNSKNSQNAQEQEQELDSKNQNKSLTKNNSSSKNITDQPIVEEDNEHEEEHEHEHEKEHEKEKEKGKENEQTPIEN